MAYVSQLPYVRYFLIVILLCCVYDSGYELFGLNNSQHFGVWFYFIVECYGCVGGCALLDRPCMFFQSIYVLCM